MGKSNAKSVKIINGDARDCNVHLKGKSIALTITSPPYYDLKDYDNKKQIGFGQSFDEYKRDLTKIFTSIYKHTKEGGSLWVVIDTYMKNGEIVMLPFIFAELMKEIGWKHKEIIIWQKDKTVPWIHSGQLRNVFEYILVFSKGKDLELNIDAVRDYANLKDWWIKYPERYNPMGKSPTTIWDFPIPVQGAWGSNNVRHFCPLPDGLVSQIIKIASERNDLVFDPFCGSGVVLSESIKLGRKSLGVELNTNYVERIKNRLKNLLSDPDVNFAIDQISFKKIVVRLRALKVAKITLDYLRTKIETQTPSIYLKFRETSGPQYGTAELFVFSKNNPVTRETISDLQQKAKELGIGLFGLKVEFKTCASHHIAQKKLYIYHPRSFYKLIGKSDSLIDKIAIYSNFNLEIRQEYEQK